MRSENCISLQMNRPEILVQAFLCFVYRVYSLSQALRQWYFCNAPLVSVRADPGDNGLDQVAINSGEAPLFLEFLLGAQFRVDECRSDGRGVHTEHRARLINCGSPPGRDSNA